MVVMDGYFDGNTVRTYEPIVAKKNQKITLTVHDEFVDSDNVDADEQEAIKKRLEALRGIFGLLDEDEAKAVDESIKAGVKFREIDI